MGLQLESSYLFVCLLFNFFFFSSLFLLFIGVHLFFHFCLVVCSFIQLFVCSFIHWFFVCSFIHLIVFCSFIFCSSFIHLSAFCSFIYLFIWLIFVRKSGHWSPSYDIYQGAINSRNALNLRLTCSFSQNNSYYPQSHHWPPKSAKWQKITGHCSRKFKLLASPRNRSKIMIFCKKENCATDSDVQF